MERISGSMVYQKKQHAPEHQLSAYIGFEMPSPTGVNGQTHEFLLQIKMVVDVVVERTNIEYTQTHIHKGK